MTQPQEPISIKVLGTVIIPIVSLILIAINNATTNNLKQETLQITKDIESLKLSQNESKFKQDLEFKYIELFYQEIVSQDSQRQNQALQLVRIFNIETADKLVIWARETGLLQASVQQEAEQTNEELFQQRKPELLYSINKYLTNYKIAIHFKSNQGEPSFNKYNSCAEEIKQKLIELGKDGNNQLIKDSQITINPGWTGQISSNQIRYERNREAEVADALDRVLFEIYPEMQFRKQTIVGKTPNYISIFLKATSNQSDSNNSKCSFIFGA